MEIEIVTFVVKGSVKLTVPTDWQEQIQVGSRSVALRRVFDLKLKLQITSYYFSIDLRFDCIFKPILFATFKSTLSQTFYQHLSQF